jgi:penicillin-binding protein 1A
MNKPFTAGERLARPSHQDDEPPPAPPHGDPTRDRRRIRRERPSAAKRGKTGWFARIVGGIAALMTLVMFVVAIGAYGAYRHFSAALPDVDGLRHYQPRQMSRVYASDSRLLAELATERRIFVPYSAIPDLVKRAFVSAEDQNFFTHRGVDPLAIMRAGVTDLMQYGQGRRPVGASTITQQVAKNMLLGNEMSMSRKVKEALLAIRIETTLSKERILELYLNEIYLGLSAYGVAAAAQTYFNKSLDDLTIPEAAFLAALPKAPNNFNPFRYYDAAKARRDYVLDRMADDHVITAEQLAQAKATPIVAAQFRRVDTLAGADYFSEEVRRRLIERFGADQTTQGGLVVRTSLDPALQSFADKTLRDALMKYDMKRGYRGIVSHLDATVVRNGGAAALLGVNRPPGMLPEWRLAVVTEETDREARLGFLDRTAGGVTQQRIAPMQLSDIAWARPVHDDKTGPTPRRMSDVVQVGDVVMAELVEQTAPGVRSAAAPRGAPAPALQQLGEHLLLRQIPLVQGALVTVEPGTGRVLALSGGWSFEQSQFNRATQAQRQPGSSFKPMVYLTAMEQGLSPSQRFLDAPFVLDMGAAGKWRPSNYELDFNGPTPLRIALEKSLNLVTVRVADHIGMEQVAQTAIAFHVVDNMPRVLPAALGAVDTTVLRQAGAYAALDAGGKEVVPTLIDSVQDRDGHILWRAPGLACACSDPSHPPVITDQRKEIADPQSVFQVVTMMQGVVQRGTGYEAGKGLNRAIAGKTGTTQDFNDAWFVGFTPDLVTAVWIGFDNPSSLGKDETGGAIAAPVWHDFMAFALRNRPNLKFVPPPGITMASWDSGFGTVTDAFKADQQPGASESIGGGDSADAGAAGTGGTAAGVDTGLGGLY